MPDEGSPQPTAPVRAARDRARSFLGGAVAAGVGLVVLAGASGNVGLAVLALVQTGFCLAALLVRGEGTFEGAPSRVTRPDTPPDLLAASPGPVVVVDARLVVTGANESARAIIPGIRTGHPLSFALRAPEVLDALRIGVLSAEPSSVGLEGRTPADATYEVLLRPLTDGAGHPLVALFFRDLTAERRVERMRVDFVATVSHELRTPLASLAGFIDTLKGAARNDVAARERFLDIMRAQANRMTRLVDDLLQLSRVESRTHLAPATSVELGPIVGHMIEIMTPLARKRGVTVNLAAQQDLSPVLGDRDELLRIVENLVENAIKYGGGGGTVDVSLSAQEDGRWVQLLVRDSGPGIAPEHLPRLTERFYRVDIAESRSQGGTGLGLAIVKHIVMRHRGKLVIQSEPGSGVEVKVWLPAAPATAPAGASLPAA